MFRELWYCRLGCDNHVRSASSNSVQTPITYKLNLPKKDVPRATVRTSQSEHLRGLLKRIRGLREHLGMASWAGLAGFSW